MAFHDDLLNEAKALTAAWAAKFERWAVWLFTLAERVIIAGAVRYAATITPATASFKPAIELTASILSYILTLTIVSSVQALVMTDLVKLLNGPIKVPVRFRPPTTVALVIIFFVGAYLTNSQIEKFLKHVTDTLGAVRP